MTNPKIFRIEYYSNHDSELADYDGICGCCGAWYNSTPKAFISKGNRYGITLISGKHDVQEYCKNKQDTIYHVATKNGDITFVIADAKKGKE